MDREDIRRWVRQRELAAQREQDELRAGNPAPGEVFERGLRMIALAGRLHGWPLPEDPLDVEQDREAYLRWARLRRALAGK